MNTSSLHHYRHDWRLEELRIAMPFLLAAFASLVAAVVVIALQ